MSTQQDKKSRRGRPRGVPLERTGYRLPVSLMNRLRACAADDSTTVTALLVRAADSYLRRRRR